MNNVLTTIAITFLSISGFATETNTPSLNCEGSLYSYTSGSQYPIKFLLNSNNNLSQQTNDVKVSAELGGNGKLYSLTLCILSNQSCTSVFPDSNSTLVYLSSKNQRVELFCSSN